MNNKKTALLPLVAVAMGLATYGIYRGIKSAKKSNFKEGVHDLLKQFDLEPFFESVKGDSNSGLNIPNLNVPVPEEIQSEKAQVKSKVTPKKPHVKNPEKLFEGFPEVLKYYNEAQASKEKPQLSAISALTYACNLRTLSKELKKPLPHAFYEDLKVLINKRNCSERTKKNFFNAIRSYELYFGPLKTRKDNNKKQQAVKKVVDQLPQEVKVKSESEVKPEAKLGLTDELTHRLSLTIIAREIEISPEDIKIEVLSKMRMSEMNLKGGNFIYFHNNSRIQKPLSDNVLAALKKIEPMKKYNSYVFSTYKDQIPLTFEEIKDLIEQ